MRGVVGSGHQVDDCLLSSMAGDIGQEWVSHYFPPWYLAQSRGVHIHVYICFQKHDGVLGTHLLG